MRAPPAGLAEPDLIAALAREWGITTASMTYLAVGAGSHHWQVEEHAGRTWFVTVDELDARRNEPAESRTSVFDRLTAAITTAHTLAMDGAGYVVAALAGRGGDVVLRLGDEWAVAVYPMVDGETFRGGQALPIADRLAVVDVIARLHTAPLPSSVPARSDDYQLENRRDLEAAIEDPRAHDIVGPYSARVADLLAEHHGLIVDMLAAYDELVGAARAHHGDRVVLTHGEPHAGNTMRTAAGWVLVDWDTALIAAPERDVWMLEPGDGRSCEAYTAATGIDVVPELLDLFRLRWDLSDLCVDVSHLRVVHAGDANDARSFEGITSVLTRRRSGDNMPPAAWR